VTVRMRDPADVMARVEALPPAVSDLTPEQRERSRREGTTQLAMLGYVVAIYAAIGAVVVGGAWWLWRRR
jgi:fatty acid desaturase